jgi:hypothetical protein
MERALVPIRAVLRVGRGSASCVDLKVLEAFIDGRIRKSGKPKWAPAPSKRQLCDELESLIEVAKQSRAPVRALSLIERARSEMENYLNTIDTFIAGAKGLGRQENQ